METMSEAIEAYEQMLNDVFPVVEFGGLTWDPADVMREMDPIAYRSGFFDWADSEGIETDDLEDDAELP